MNLKSAFMKTFSNVDKMSIAFIYIGLQFTLGLLAAAIIFTLLEGRYGDYTFIIACAQGSKEAALTSGAFSLVAAFLCDVAVKDKQKKQER